MQKLTLLQVHLVFLGITKNDSYGGFDSLRIWKHAEDARAGVVSDPAFQKLAHIRREDFVGGQG